MCTADVTLLTMLLLTISEYGKPSDGCNIIERILKKLCCCAMKPCLKFLLGALALNTELRKS
jgi:hypothetical protein